MEIKENITCKRAVRRLFLHDCNGRCIHTRRPLWEVVCLLTLYLAERCERVRQAASSQRGIGKRMQEVKVGEWVALRPLGWFGKGAMLLGA